MYDNSTSASDRSRVLGQADLRSVQLSSLSHARFLILVDQGARLQWHNGTEIRCGETIENGRPRIIHN